jgi:hypothetical protein
MISSDVAALCRWKTGPLLVLEDVNPGERFPFLAKVEFRASLFTPLAPLKAVAARDPLRDHSSRS